MKIEEMIAASRVDCSGCEACANICPKNAIEMTRDAEGFAYPKINTELCIKCGRCDATCPALNFKKKIPTALPETFAAIYTDDKIRRYSSSGGIFSALSEIILQSGGIVFGAAFDKNWHVFHTAAQNSNELENLRGSKYVQSKIGNVYRQVKDALKSRQVLFSGTPCQCAALKHFLGSDSDNLLTVEIICHGTPPPALWEYYIDMIGYAHEIEQVNFRSKRLGWKDPQLEINFSDQGYKTASLGKDLYGKFFTRNVSLRPSCSACKFRFPNGQADLTIGDAWGIEEFAPKMFDNLGTSIIFVHTQKGKAFFEQANLKRQQVSFVDAAKKNPLFIAPTAADSRRGKFFAELAKSNDKLAVMEKYYQQDDRKISRETVKKYQLDYQKNLEDIFNQIRQQFAKNILVAVNPVKEIQIKLENFFERKFQNCGIYFLTADKDDIFSCKETFSTLTFNFKDGNELADFAKKFKWANVYVENPLNWKSNIFLEWLKSSGLPLQTFIQKLQ